MYTKDFFFDLLRIALGHKDVLQEIPSPEQWHRLFDMSGRQALLGVCASAVGQLPSEQRPPREIALRWAFLASRTEERNRLVSLRAAEVTRLFAAEGLRSCVLKGQGVARLYPEPLRRQSGDIDLWVEGDDRTISRVVRKYCPGAKARYHHIDFAAFGDVPVEVHFRPSWMFSPLRNRRLQRWLRSHHDWNGGLTDEGYHVPSAVFNAVFILTHIFRHIFDEGIGLRQILDYYYVIRSLDAANDTDLAASLRESLRRLGLLRFCRGVMYVLREAFGLPERDMPVAPNAALGRFLLDEILQAGNFGHYDSRLNTGADESPLHIFLRRQRRGLRLLRWFPGEVIWAPFFHVYQRVWRWRRGYL